MNKEFWETVYAEKKVSKKESSFARFCLPLIRGTLVDLGCGNGRDLYFFRDHGITAFGVDASNEDLFIHKEDVASYIRQTTSQPDNVYTRFFWHAIEPELQEQILKWTPKRLFIEARTKKDKPHNVVGKHFRNLVDVDKLLKQLEDYKFSVLSCEQGHGFSVYEGEDPHLVRIVADRQ